MSRGGHAVQICMQAGADTLRHTGVHVHALDRERAAVVHARQRPCLLPQSHLQRGHICALGTPPPGFCKLDAHMQVCLCVCLVVCVCACVGAFLRACAHVCACLCVYLNVTGRKCTYVCVRVHVCVCMCTSQHASMCCVQSRRNTHRGMGCNFLACVHQCFAVVL